MWRFLALLSLIAVLAGSLLRPQLSCAQTTPSQGSDPRTACASDVQKLCASVQPGGGRIVACLKQHKDQVSDGCKQAILGAMQRSGGNSGGVPSPAPAPPAEQHDATSAPSSSSSSDAPETPATTRPATTTKSPASGSSAAKANAAGTQSSSYLRMKQVQVIAKVNDPAFGGKADVPALDMLIPSTWSFKSNVFTNTKEGCFSDFFVMAWEATSSDGIMAFQGVPNDSWQYSDDPAELKKLNDPNRRQLGLGGKPCPVMKPTSAADYLRTNVLTVFPKGSTIVSVDPYPELNQIARKQLGLPDDPGNSAGTRTDAVRARVKFVKDGKNLEDFVTAVVVTRVFRQGRGTFYDCHAIDIMALRVPEGQLDANDKLFKVMISSIRPEQKWQSYSNGVIAKLYQAEAQKEAVMDQMIATFQKQVADTINGVVANSVRGANQAAFGQDQLIRGVQTFRDPSTGNTMELSNQYDHAWLNGQNEYVMSDDPNFNPNGQLNGDWNQLQLVRPQP